jgi:hypothetical protein
MTWKTIPDSVVPGFFLGFISLVLFYVILAYARIFIVNYYGNPYLLMAPRIHLFSIFLNILLFRFFMIKKNKEKFGKGILLATVMASLVYFFYYFKYHQSII